jgi:hypothetical protein
VSAPHEHSRFLRAKRPFGMTNPKRPRDKAAVMEVTKLKFLCQTIPYFSESPDSPTCPFETRENNIPRCHSERGLASEESAVINSQASRYFSNFDMRRLLEGKTFTAVMLAKTAIGMTYQASAGTT